MRTGKELAGAADVEDRCALNGPTPAFLRTHWLRPVGGSRRLDLILCGNRRPDDRVRPPQAAALSLHLSMAKRQARAETGIPSWRGASRLGGAPIDGGELWRWRPRSSPPARADR